MTILALESSGLVASVAVITDGKLLGEFTTNFKKTHSQTLMPMLDQLLTTLDLTLEQVDAIAVSKGPGSFTGLRIGSATAKGLGLALQIPVIGVPTVDALAYNLQTENRVICPLMDARRKQVYTGLYQFDHESFNVIKPQTATSVEQMVRTINEMGQPVVFLGDGVPVYKEMIEELITVDHVYAPMHLAYQRAGALGALAEIYYKEGNYETASQHRPDYLRLSQAEREMMEKNADYKP